MKIYFRKTFEYDPQINGLSKYESYDRVVRQTYSPEIVTPQSHENFDLPTLCSNLKRCIQTAEIISSGRITILNELREIKFSMHGLLSEKEYEEFGSNMVRERFIQAFINDSLLEKRIEIQKRMKRVIKLITKGSNDKLVVSHSFAMKIFEAFFLHKKDIFTNSSLISEFIFPQTKTYGFGEGFEVII